MGDRTESIGRTKPAIVDAGIASGDTSCITLAGAATARETRSDVRRATPRSQEGISATFPKPVGSALAGLFLS